MSDKTSIDVPEESTGVESPPPFSCECSLTRLGLRSGLCDRHGVLKSGREQDICRGGDNIPASLRNKFLEDWGESVSIPDGGGISPPGHRQVVRGQSTIPQGVLRGITPDQVPCEYRGERLRTDKCTTCGTKGKPTEVYRCNWTGNSKRECTLLRSISGISDCKNCRHGRDIFTEVLDNLVPITPVRSQVRGRPPRQLKRAPSPFVPADHKPRFITKQQFSVDIHALASRIPVNTSRIIAVARSGLAVGSMLSMYLHLPLEIVRQDRGDLIYAGNGWRLTGNTGGSGPPLVVDDTCMSGNSFKHVMPIVRAKYPEAKSACVYCNPAAHVKPDLFVHELPWPHFLEWNMFNSVNTESLACDFDGVICRDCYPGEDDDGEKYLNFIRTATPLYPVRKVQLKLVVTARLSKYRAETEAWLARNGISVKKLVMAPWKTLRERQRQDMGTFKARYFKRFLTERHAVKPAAFVESDPNQARRIYELTGGVVICPSSGECHAG